LQPECPLQTGAGRGLVSVLLSILRVAVSQFIAKHDTGFRGGCQGRIVI
jgi:hypothetical protein